MSDYKIIDLTIWLDDFVFPGNPELKVSGPINRVSGTNPEFVYDFEFCSQSGTHIQGSHYFNKDGQQIDQYKLDHFEGYAHIIDVSKRGEDITLSDLKKEIDNIHLEDMILLFRTGYMDDLINNIDDSKQPGLSLDAAKYLCEVKKIKMIAIDALGVESIESKNYEVNVYLTTQNILILECLTNLHLLSGRPFIEAFPLKIKGVEGTPCRAIAKVYQK